MQFYRFNAVNVSLTASEQCAHFDPETFRSWGTLLDSFVLTLAQDGKSGDIDTKASGPFALKSPELQLVPRSRKAHCRNGRDRLDRSAVAQYGDRVAGQGEGDRVGDGDPGV